MFKLMTAVAATDVKNIKNSIAAAFQFKFLTSFENSSAIPTAYTKNTKEKYMWILLQSELSSVTDSESNPLKTNHRRFASEFWKL